MLETEPCTRQPGGLSVELFSTAPQSADYPAERFSVRLTEVASWSEKAGCTGILIYSDNSLIDPWLAAQVVIEQTRQLSPLVALQPVYMHPFSAAKMVASLSYLYGRRMSLNMIAGGFRNDLLALCDETPHDERYIRLTEYTTILKELLAAKHPLTFCGKYYKVKNLMLKPPLAAELFPRLLMSGSSQAGRDAAQALGAIAVEYPEPGGNYDNSTPRTNCGIRIGVITAQDADEAWQIAHRRFPGDRTGQLKHLVAMKVSDSQWHKQLSNISASSNEPESGIYWLWPFKNYNTFCPYLVGSQAQVSDELAKYMTAGFKTYILDIPVEESDLVQAAETFALAELKYTQNLGLTPEAGASRPRQSVNI
jgi:alkanesulfonate monooxygenase